MSWKVFDQNGRLLVSSAAGGSGSGLTIEFLAQQNIAAFQPVTSDGFIADSSNVAHKNRVIGISTEAVSTGFKGKAIGFGQITNPAWLWTAGDKIFLNGAGIASTAAATGFSLQMGTAISDMTVDIILGPSILF